jgi:alpha-tubulin suppressor-like RCC1 family protein
VGGRPAIAFASVLAASLAIPALAPAGGAAAASRTTATASRTTATARLAATPPAAWGWGTNDDDSLGSGSGVLFSETPLKVKLPSGTVVTSVRAGCDHSVAVTSTGHALGWGSNNEGQVGDGTTKQRPKPVQVKLPKGTKLSAIRAGCEHTIGLTSTGHVLGWGLNLWGQVGDGTTKQRNAPVQVKLPKGVKAKAVTAGCDHSLALSTTGKLYAWGRNDFGQLGDGTMKNRHTPVKVKLPSGTVVTSVAAGCDHTLAVANNGTWVWGDNQYGQLGIGSTTGTATPVELIILTRGQPLGNITGLFGGCRDSIALFSKGAVLVWGDNSMGQLGNGTTTSSDKPTGVMLPTGTKVKSVSAGCFDSYALTSAGKVLAWGDNADGELGADISSQFNDLPTQVALPTTFTATNLGAGPGALHAFVIGHNG